MLRKAVSILGLVALLAAACGGDPIGDPDEAADCEQLADVSVVLVQEFLDELNQMSAQDMLDATGAESPVFAEFGALGTQLADRAEELGCSQAEMTRLSCERFGNLRATSEVAIQARQSVLAGCPAQ